MPDVKGLCERLDNIAAVLEANKDKFAVPEHITAKAATIRSTKAALEQLQAEFQQRDELLREFQQRECSSWCDPTLNEHTRFCVNARALLQPKEQEAGE